LNSGIALNFAKSLVITQVETIRKIQQAFGDEAMSITQIKEWYNRFKDGRTSVDSEPRSGRPSTSRNDVVIHEVRTLVMQNRRITIRELTHEVGISHGSVQSILYGANERTCGQRELGSCITTMHPHILRI
jgi:transposase